MKIFEKRFKEYLKKNKEFIKEPRVTICIGNEGMDLDSFVSSLVIGFAEDVIHVVNMRKEVFLAKGDLMHVCKAFGINVDDLIYLERPLIDIEFEVREIGTYFLVDNEQVPLKTREVKLYLSDHNEPVMELKNCEIALIIDHHPLESNVEHARRIYIDIDVGSATTLVAKYLGNDLSKKNHCAHDPKNQDPEKETLCASIAKLLLIPIIIDTKFLKRRTSIFDIKEYKRLKKKANITRKELKKIRKNLKEDRRNDHKLNTEIILQKDFKIFTQDNTKFGMATVKYDFKDWVNRDGALLKDFKPDQIGIALYLGLNDFRKKLGLQFLIVGCKLKKKRHFVPINFPLIERFANNNGWIKVEYKGLEYYRAPVGMSRKIVAPIIREYLMKLVLDSIKSKG